MRNTSVDQRCELILGLDLSVENVVRNIDNLQQFHLVTVLTEVLHFQCHVTIVGEVVHV